MVSHDFKCGEIDCGLMDWTAALDYWISFNGITWLQVWWVWLPL